jgi:hypothetical protein
VSDPQVDAVLALLSTAGRFEELVALLAELDAGQRKKLSTHVRSVSAAIKWNADNRATALTALGCVTGLRQVVTVLDTAHVTPDVATLAVQVLETRRPDWLAELPAALLVRREPWPAHFPLVRALVRRGAVPVPSFPEYAEAMVWGLSLDRQGPVLEQLRADPELLDRELWLLLSTERAGRTLTQHDAVLLHPERWSWAEPPPPRPEHTWQHALTTLAGEGALDRDRLLDTTLGAFFCDWAAVDVAWFLELHDVLAPTPAELRARQDRYARLLAAEHGPVVKLGLRVLSALHGLGHLDADLLLASAPAALARRDKGTVVATLGLLSGVATGDPALAERVAEVAATALQHERVDVQERALALLTALVPDADRRGELRERFAEQLAPSIRPRLVEVAEPPALPETAADEPILPARDADEVAELFSRLIEEADDPVGVERLLDGVLRHAAARPRHGADVLASRAETLRADYFPGPWTGEELRADLAALALVWLRGVPPGRGFLGRDHRWDTLLQPLPRLVSPPRLGRGSSLGEVLTRRVHETARGVAAGGAVSLALPTSRSGALSAEALNLRVAEVDPGAEPLAIDTCVALLRVPPAEYDRLRFPERHRTGRHLAEQLRLVRDRRRDWELVVGRDERARRNERHAGRPTQVTWRTMVDVPSGLAPPLLAVLDRTDPLGTFDQEVDDGEYASRFEQVTGQWPALLPHDPDLLAVHAHPRLYRGLIKNRAASEPLLDALGSSPRPIGAPTCSALLLGLSAKNGGERARAVDAVLELARRSALPGGVLGRVFADLLRAEALVASRVAQGMTEAARAQPSAGDALLDCLVEVLPALAGRREAHAFVDLLTQLAIERGRSVALPEPFAGTAAGRGTSLLAQACRRVPQPQ